MHGRGKLILAFPPIDFGKTIDFGKKEISRNEELARSKQVSELLFFGLQILFGMNVVSRLAGHTLSHDDATLFQGRNLFRIIREQADA